MSTSTFDAHVVLACQNTLGEGITWDDRTQRLHWVDIDRAEVHTYDPATKTHAAAHYPESEFMSALAPRNGPGLVAATEAAVVLIDPPFPSPYTEENSTRTIIKPLDPAHVDDKLVRFNDGACDAKGRLWIGSMTRPEKRDGTQRGELWRVEPDGTASRFLEEVGTSNGIDWSPDNTRMYYIDSNVNEVSVFDYDLEAGVASNRRQFVPALPGPNGNAPGVYDGLVVDGVGNVWVARWGDSRVVVFSPDGKLLAQVNTPGARSPTIPCFGGPDLRTLYIATANANLAGQGDIQAQFPESGNVFGFDCSSMAGVLGPDWKGRVRHRFGG
ncbi:hypothetical protein CcaverHIS002_0504850 [Cutaneotrichosporon cavernicola]|uniref:SMP-30/Gluconolactonase/LRE-like region domain-containing protein n=1 Tax=Cutaneotrichosporon cavernicola TaxID=279322 RepID=A0AA48QX14_9TREE|nr:uncharacterized protein CcaverHIS019_0505390 [Cutaneotrichosporon cavernicola]BEI85084.1 hypothetical protein CcaverHIS002_0504850 [Cutaneotrichosporon cavernicola]BEI92911.1 hypothetical protein CcaverHIS019_0505390 [Cutaneotrichosporon cavernicola]BEJ00687.1 hypothetical protein CcaverHIS631_0505440 [Cutaneotrichosporon cavernicola]BEJ08454.1 hypothetical protein CcaverHIS641_0505480 [Cutaneotrichosporon cavernicola]